MGYWKGWKIAKETARRMKEHADRCRNCVDDKECKTYLRIFWRGSVKAGEEWDKGCARKSKKK